LSYRPAHKEKEGGNARGPEEKEERQAKKGLNGLMSLDCERQNKYNYGGQSNHQPEEAKIVNPSSTP
jgi:hypothetical protein